MENEFQDDTGTRRFIPRPPPAQQYLRVSDRGPQFKTAQHILSDFWDGFHHRAPGKITTIFPRNLYRGLVGSHHDSRNPTIRNACASWEEAASACRAKVDRIVKECRRTNEKYTDTDFDFQSDTSNCLYGLMRDYPNRRLPVDRIVVTTVDSSSGSEAPIDRRRRRRHPSVTSDQYMEPLPVFHYGSIHRVNWIFEKPRFTVDGYSASDIKQGGCGDCWFLAAVATIAHRQDLMDKIIVAKDEECGVYGFVFHRDGEWIYTAIDDNLFLNAPDFAASPPLSNGNAAYDPTGKLAREHKQIHQTGSKALSFASCEDQNETWLPLLEKAYAKTHNDFMSIEAGFSGDGVEDLTGGANTTLMTSRILSKNQLWKELLNEKGEFVFSLGLNTVGGEDNRSGMTTGHAYSLLKAVEAEGEDGKTVKLVQIRNPWGSRDMTGTGEWNGPWSDGSREWTPYWLSKLNYKFGNDGVFWMTFDDMIFHYEQLHRTRLFNSEWTLAQQWTSVNVSWVTGFLRKKFVIDVKNGGLFVFVLSQLDERYWTGLQGEYTYQLHFLLRKEGTEDAEIVGRARSDAGYDMRSTNCEVELEPGRYELLPKIVASKRTKAPTDSVIHVVQTMASTNPKKLRQVGMQYDLAHARVGVVNEDEVMEKDRLKQERRTRKQDKQQEKLRKKEKASSKRQEAQAKRWHEKNRIRQKKNVERNNKDRARRRIEREKAIEERAKRKAEKEANPGSEVQPINQYNTFDSVETAEPSTISISRSGTRDLAGPTRDTIPTAPTPGGLPIRRRVTAPAVSTNPRPQEQHLGPNGSGNTGRQHPRMSPSVSFEEHRPSPRRVDTLHEEPPRHGSPYDSDSDSDNNGANARHNHRSHCRQRSQRPASPSERIGEEGGNERETSCHKIRMRALRTQTTQSQFRDDPRHRAQGRSPHHFPSPPHQYRSRYFSSATETEVSSDEEISPSSSSSDSSSDEVITSTSNRVGVEDDASGLAYGGRGGATQASGYDREGKKDHHHHCHSSSSSESNSGRGAALALLPGNQGWNPVVVIGLRCYSKDSGVMVSLVDPEEEGGGVKGKKGKKEKKGGKGKEGKKGGKRKDNAVGTMGGDMGEAGEDKVEDKVENKVQQKVGGKVEEKVEERVDEHIEVDEHDLLGM